MGEAVLPSGVVTFLLTDVVGSTRLWAAAPAAMEEALATHDRIVADVVAEHRGTVLKPRGEGDSTFSVFARATDALRAAYAVHVRLGHEPWPQPVSIQVRMAVHSGEAVERDGDFLGTAVNRAARLRGVANAGHVLVSTAVAELVADHLPAQLELIDAGQVRLADLDRPESVYLLAGPELPAGRRPASASPMPDLTALLEERGVTRREAEVLDALGERLTNAEIAARLYVSERTVESHVSSLLRKLEANNRVELAQLAKQAAAALRPAVGLPAPLELLADRQRYVGRETEYERLRALWHHAAQGHTRVAVLAGEAGIGKSRLAAELAAEVHDAGGRVLLGSCFEDLQLPYQPFAQAILDDASTAPASEVRRRAGPGGPALARMVPDLGALLGSIPSPVQGESVAERAEAFAAMHGYLSRTAETTPVLLVVEDLHWASATTRDLLRHIARVGGHAPLLIVATTRDTAPDLDDELAVFLADLAHVPGVEHIRLSGLGPDEIAALLAGIGSSADPEAVARQTAGNPLFARELGAGPAGSGLSLPGLLARRYARLDEADLSVLDLASVLGAEFEADLVAHAADRPLTEVLESLERAEAAGLVAATPGRPGRFGFVHALFRSARYDDLGASRRLRLHRQVAWALEGKADDHRVLPELARHACIAAPLGDARAAVDHARRAAELAERALAHDQAAVHYAQAIDVVEFLDPPDPALRLRLTIHLGRALNRMGDPANRQALLDAAREARLLADAGALAEIAWSMSQDGTPTTPGQSDPDFVAVAEDALAGLPAEPSSARALTLAALSADLNVGGDPDRAFVLATEAVHMARQVDDAAVLGHVLLASRHALRVPWNETAGEATADELIDLGRSTGHSLFTVHGLVERAWALRRKGALAASDQATDEAAGVLGEGTLPNSSLRVHLVFLRSGRHLLTGDLAAAETAARALLPLAQGGGFDPVPWLGPALLMIRHSQGRIAEHIAGLEVDRPGFRDFIQSMLAVAYGHGGRLDEAATILRRFTERGGVEQRNFFWLPTMALLCEAAEMADSADAGRLFLEQLEPFEGQIAELPNTPIGPVDLALAQAALAAKDNGQAATAAARAVATSRERGTPIYLARELLRWAEARRRLGETTDDVRPLLDEAIAIAEDTGAELVRHEARRLGLIPA